MFGCTVTTVVIFHERMVHRVGNGCATPRRVPILWQSSGDSTLRLPAQSAWNDARGRVFGVGTGQWVINNSLTCTVPLASYNDVTGMSLCTLRALCEIKHVILTSRDRT